eukprot:gnl/MRDRNA2_/MRDRNA2_114219_c0_seq1.p1 gnl/MRDRNA2_/MRDRNA2_114219_c0~~gnl/MRDRNA2_/MRDRNA2_114219_c0_seq1.p1  ORF type:complete len:699 (+),score=121.66 gnl/MRDRNA2_/MRDRNA2_114219_c0_seq1:146-2242(+)
MRLRHFLMIFLADEHLTKVAGRGKKGCESTRVEYKSEPTFGTEHDFHNQQVAPGCLLQRTSTEHKWAAIVPESRPTALHQMMPVDALFKPLVTSSPNSTAYDTQLQTSPELDHGMVALMTATSKSLRNKILVGAVTIMLVISTWWIVQLYWRAHAGVENGNLLRQHSIGSSSSPPSTARPETAREQKDVTDVTASEESLISIARKIVQEQEHKNNTFEESVGNLLSHISFAPDGGICNLMRHCHPGQVEPSRLVLVDKGFSGKATAAMMLLCVVINLENTIFEATYVILCYFSGGSFSEICPHRYEQQELSRKITLPIPEIALAVATIELSWAVMLLLDSLYRVVTFSMMSLSFQGPDTDFDEQKVVEVYKKYQHLAILVWNNLHELGSFSALLTLGFVHPGVIGHYARDQCRCGHRASLGLLKTYLRLDNNEDKDLKKLTTDQVHYLGVVRLLRLQLVIDKATGISNIQQTMRQNLHSSMLKLLVTLRNAEQNLKAISGDVPETASPNVDQLEVDIEALRLLWRVQTVAAVEATVFWIWSLFLLLCGVAAFTLKVGFIADNLFDPRVNVCVGMMHVLGFLIQVLGIVQVQKLLRWRLFRFIFGGQDAEVSIEERLVERMYEARLAHSIWSSHHMGFSKKVVTLLNLNDDDLQRLMLQEVEYKKAQMIGPLWEAVGKDERHALKGTFQTYALKWAKSG